MPEFKLFLNKGLEGIMNKPYPFEVIEANKKAAIEKFGAGRIIDFGVGDPTDPTPEAVRNACKLAVDDRKSSGYPTAIGQGAFREKVAEWFSKRFGVSVNPENEVVSNFGAKQAVFLMPLHFINPNTDSVVLMPNPGYPPYKDGTLLAGARPYHLNLLEENGFLPDLGSIPAETVSKARMLYVNSPQNPTGKVYSKEKLKEAVDFCLDNNILLVSDECYSENYYGEKPLSILQVPNAEQCSIVVNSLSKQALMTGYRIGFVVIKNPEIMKAYRLFEQKSHSGVATFIQDAAVAALSNETLAQEMNKTYSQRMDTLIPGLEAYGMKAGRPEATFYLWARIPEGREPVEFATKLLNDKGINCTPGNLISEEFEGVNPGQHHVRFALVLGLEKTREAAERLSE